MGMSNLITTAPAHAALEERVAIRVISSMATRQVLTELIVQFEQQTEYKVDLDSVGGVEAAKRVQAGEIFDVIILASNAIDKLIDSGQIVQGSRIDLVRSGVAVAVREGAQRIDVSSEEALKQAVLNAKTLCYSTGPSGVYLAGLFEGWGIMDQIKNRIVQAPPGVPVGSLVAKGEAELGFQQLSELLHLEGIVISGPLPADIQIMTIFSAGTTADSAQPESAKSLLNFLASPKVARVKFNHGMEPA